MSMSVNELERAHLVLDSLFTDALSEEFYPECDPKRQHTLAQLAVETYLKGEVSVYDNLGGTNLKYTPSWAPSVEAFVFYTRGTAKDEPKPANYLNIRNSETHTGFSVTGSIDADRGVVVRLQKIADGRDFDHLEEMGGRLQVVRTDLAQAALKVFASS